MSMNEVEYLLSSLAGMLGSFIGPIVASFLSGIFLTYCIRWFLFFKAGEKGWKALIPFYSDYICYSIVWDGRIYLALLIGSVASTILGALFGLINPGVGMFVSIVLSTAVASVDALAKLILNFKYARAFGRSSYFAIGLYFLNNIFAAVLAFGDCEYKGVPKDGIGVPKFFDQIGAKKADMPVDYPGYQQPMQPPVQQPPVQAPVQRPQAQRPAQQPGYQGYQQPYGNAGYPPVQQQYPQPPQYPQRSTTGSYPPVQNYPPQNGGQNPYNF